MSAALILLSVGVLFIPNASVYITVPARLLILFYLFGAMASICDCYMMPATDIICERLGMSDDVAGVTLLAFTSSAPEIVISIVGVLHHKLR